MKKILLVLVIPFLLYANEKTESLQYKIPAKVVLEFMDAVKSADEKFLNFFDIYAFFERNEARLKGCSEKEIKQYFRELVMLPVRHRAPINSNVIEEKSYEINEKIIGYRKANVAYIETTNNEKLLNVRFKLISNNEKWVIVDMNGYFESYIFQACK